MSTQNDALPGAVRQSWQRFLDVYEPLRPELYRYARHLTRSPWDAEDLAQETLARAFVIVAQSNAPPPNPRAWLFRVASNVWIDRIRQAQRELPAQAQRELPAQAQRELPAPGDPAATVDPRATREAAGTVLGLLAPQERAAVVLKDAFDFSLDEIAVVLATTTGAVKAALHRGRTKLDAPDVTPATPAPAVLDAFCAAFQARDLDRLASLLLDSSVVEVVGATTEYGPEAAKKTVLWGMLFGVDHLVEIFPDALPVAPRVELRFHRGEWLVLSWYAHRDGDAVRAVTRLDTTEDGIRHVRNYFYNPDFIAEVCGELDVPFRTQGNRYWTIGCAK